MMFESSAKSKKSKTKIRNGAKSGAGERELSQPASLPASPASLTSITTSKSLSAAYSWTLSLLCHCHFHHCHHESIPIKA
jgi:hypothetical protein